MQRHRLGQLYASAMLVTVLADVKDLEHLHMPSTCSRLSAGRCPKHLSQSAATACTASITTRRLLQPCYSHTRSLKHPCRHAGAQLRFRVSYLVKKTKQSQREPGRNLNSRPIESPRGLLKATWASLSGHKSLIWFLDVGGLGSAPRCCHRP